MRLRILTLASVLLLVGCSASAPDSSSPSDEDALTGLDVSDASETQAAEISDRKATNDEYQAAFTRYRECLSAAGYELSDVTFSNSMYEFGVPNAAVEDGVDDDCYISEFRYVDMLWQSTDTVQNQSDTAEFLRECLSSRGVDPAETLQEMETQMRDHGLAVSECVS